MTVSQMFWPAVTAVVDCDTLDSTSMPTSQTQTQTSQPEHGPRESFKNSEVAEVTTSIPLSRHLACTLEAEILRANEPSSRLHY